MTCFRGASRSMGFGDSRGFTNRGAPRRALVGTRMVPAAAFGHRATRAGARHSCDPARPGRPYHPAHVDPHHRLDQPLLVHRLHGLRWPDSHPPPRALRDKLLYPLRWRPLYLGPDRSGGLPRWLVVYMDDDTDGTGDVPAPC